MVVIEDDPVARKSIERMLAVSYRSILCATVREGLDALNDEVYAVILDVKLKGETKYGAFEQIRKVLPDVPIIFYAVRGEAVPPSQAVIEHKPFGSVAGDGDPRRLLDALDIATRLYQTTMRSRRLLQRIRRGRPEDV